MALPTLQLVMHHLHLFIGMVLFGPNAWSIPGVLVLVTGTSKRASNKYVRTETQIFAPPRYPCATFCQNVRTGIRIQQVLKLTPH